MSNSNFAPWLSSPKEFFTKQNNVTSKISFANICNFLALKNSLKSFEKFCVWLQQCECMQYCMYDYMLYSICDCMQDCICDCMQYCTRNCMRTTGWENLFDFAEYEFQSASTNHNVKLIWLIEYHHESIESGTKPNVLYISCELPSIIMIIWYSQICLIPTLYRNAKIFEL